MSIAIPLVPRMSEKAYQESLSHNTYTFVVPMSANETTIAYAVQTQFKVTVEDVRTAVIKGKSKKSYRKGSRPVVGKRADYKKAYVRVKSGDKISIFEEEKTTKNAKQSSEALKANKPAIQAETKQKRGLGGILGRTQRQTQNRGGE